MAGSFYNANPLLKGSGVSIDFTPEQLEEYIKCKQDPIYFIKHYVKIISLDKGLIPFELFPYQERFILALKDNRRVLGMFPRQMGKCLRLNTKVKLKQKSTGEIVEVTLGEFYVWQKLFEHGIPAAEVQLQNLQKHG